MGLMTLGEVESHSIQEQVAAVLNDEGMYQALPRQIGLFTLRQELTGPNKPLAKILNILEGHAIALREGCVDKDGVSLLIPMVDVLRPLAIDYPATDEELSRLLVLSIAGPYHTNILLNKATGDAIFFTKEDK